MLTFLLADDASALEHQPYSAPPFSPFGLGVNTGVLLKNSFQSITLVRGQAKCHHVNVTTHEL